MASYSRVVLTATFWALAAVQIPANNNSNNNRLFMGLVFNISCKEIFTINNMLTISEIPPPSPIDRSIGGKNRHAFFHKKILFFRKETITFGQVNLFARESFSHLRVFE